MPIAAPVIAAGIAAAGQGFNAYAQGKMNKKTRDFSKDMYARQRADNLADWNAQNAYNHPKQQMQRLKEAGLNPNLAYGNPTEASSIGQASFQKPDMQAPQFDPGSIMGAYMDTKRFQMTTDQTRQNMENMEAQNRLIEANILKTYADTDTKNFDLQMKQKLSEIYSQTAEQNLRKLTTGTDIAIDKWSIQKVKEATSIDKMLQEIINLKEKEKGYGLEREKTRQEIKNLKAVTQLNVWKSLSEQQKIKMADVLRESKLLDMILTGKKTTGQILDNGLKSIEYMFRQYGLSPTVTSDVLKGLGGLFKSPAGKGGFKQLPKNKVFQNHYNNKFR